MKIEIEAVKKMLDSAIDESKKQGECDNLDKMFNLGIMKLYYTMQCKLFDAELLVRRSEK